MIAPKRKDSGYRRMIVEALDRIASPEVRDQIVEMALAIAGAKSVFAELPAASAFVAGPLHQVVSERIGAGEADALVADLAPLLHRANEHESGVRRSTRRDAASRRATGQRPIAVVVDDDALVRTAIDRVLRARGWRVLPAENGHLALGLCLRHGPDIVVSDWEMPVVDGLSLAKAISRTFGDNAPPFILLTASEIAGLPKGVTRVVKKPLDPQELVAIIDPLVQASWGPEGDED